jgi:hypothetical protein
MTTALVWCSRRPRDAPPLQHAAVFVLGETDPPRRSARRLVSQECTRATPRRGCSEFSRRHALPGYPSKAACASSLGPGYHRLSQLGTVCARHSLHSSAIARWFETSAGTVRTASVAFSLPTVPQSDTSSCPCPKIGQLCRLPSDRSTQATLARSLPLGGGGLVQRSAECERSAPDGSYSTSRSTRY